MTTRVLVPMDGSEMAERALSYALETHPDAAVTVLHVVGEPSPMWGEAAGLALEDDLDAAAADRARPVFERAREIASDADLTTEVAVGHPARAILDHCEDHDAVVLGTHGGSLSETLLVGDVAKAVFRRAPIPVTVVR